MDEVSEDNRIQDDGWLVIQPECIVPGLVPELNRQKARVWSLVLDARGVPCCLEQHPEGLELLVPCGYQDQAYGELCLFEAHNSGWPTRPPPARPLIENTLATISILILLAVFHNITQLDVPLFGVFMPEWVDIGNAQAAKILDGQWWRLVTALTLHADWAHLSSNLAIGGIFVVFLCRELGSGLAWSLLLGAGTLGNLVNAYVQSPNHSSVGASTAVFGAVGILAALSLVRYPHNLRTRWMLPVAGALALLALLGTEGKNTDLGAHLFGFVYGGCLGLIAEYLVGRHGLPGRFLNALLAVSSIGVVLAAWWVALHNV